MMQGLQELHLTRRRVTGCCGGGCADRQCEAQVFSSTHMCRQGLQVVNISANIVELQQSLDKTIFVNVTISQCVSMLISQKSLTLFHCSDVKETTHTQH
jgi:hypothetical protein